ncbi:hypothetical protein [Kitasatospora sp. NPDC101183]|uniref:hypothetical protein n=1 Tax=Kitasatospora sp. NPDC101183 TaxID=3364100 RepID=UPI00381F7596
MAEQGVGGDGAVVGGSGWWREFTSVFMQNGGLFGGLWNLVTLAAAAWAVRRQVRQGRPAPSRTA